MATNRIRSNSLTELVQVIKTVETEDQLMDSTICVTLSWNLKNWKDLPKDKWGTDDSNHCHHKVNFILLVAAAEGVL